MRKIINVFGMVVAVVNTVIAFNNGNSFAGTGWLTAAILFLSAAFDNED